MRSSPCEMFQKKQISDNEAGRKYFLVRTKDFPDKFPFFAIDTASIWFQPLIKSKSHLYFEDKDDVPGTLERLKPVRGAYIAFYKNGKLQGQTFHNLYG